MRDQGSESPREAGGHPLAPMAADADRVILAGPAELRRIGTRRSRAKVAAAACAVLVVVVGVAAGVGRPEASVPWPGGSPTPAPSSSAPSSVAPSSGAPAFTSPMDPVDRPPDPCELAAANCVRPGAASGQERLPAPCATTTNASDAKILARRSKIGSTYFSDGNGTTMLGETVTRYSGTGATDYLDEVRAAVARCPSVKRPGFRGGTDVVRHAVIGTDQLGGDRSLLVRVTYPTVQEGDGVPADNDFLVAVVRVGDVVVVVYDHGWEGSASPRRTFDAFLAGAIARART